MSTTTRFRHVSRVLCLPTRRFRTVKYAKLGKYLIPIRTRSCVVQMSAQQRPDRAQALKKRRVEKHSVVKCSLPGLLIGHDDALKRFRALVDDMVENVSRRVDKASLLLNRYLIDRLSQNKPLPNLGKDNQAFYAHLLNIGIGNCRNPADGLEDVWNACFVEKGFPKIDKLEGITNAVLYAARTYRTSFLNSLWCAFDVRQKYLIKAWLIDNGLDEGILHAVKCAINGWDCNTAATLLSNNEDLVEFIGKQREILGLAGQVNSNSQPWDKIDDAWLRIHPQEVVMFYWKTLQYLESLTLKYQDEPEKQPRLFTLCPMCTIKRHFIIIDSRVLYYLMRDAGIIGREWTRNEFEKKEAADVHFRNLFKVDKLASKKNTFSRMIQTDGVSACVHFARYETAPSVTAEEGSRDFSDERLIGLDGGRINIVMAVEKLDDDNFKIYRLTRGEYYERAGIKRRNRRTAKWQAKIQVEELTFSQKSRKTTDAQQFDAFLADYFSVYNKLWEAKLKKKRAQESFRVYCKKHKVLDGFFQSMRGEREPVIAFGDAKFPPGGRGEVSVPTEYVKARCRKYFTTVMVDEFRTSSVCPCCDAALCKVAVRYTDALNVTKVRQVRGLKRCSAEDCAQFSFKDRDVVGARNILRCLSGARPQSLTRIQGQGRLNVDTFYIEKKG